MSGRYEELTIGSIGFAQYGSPDYFEKREIEKTVLREIVATDEAFKIPEEFEGICRFKLARCEYEDGSYDELQLIYDWRELSHNGEEFESRFWEWASEIECFDLEKEEYTDKCYSLLNQKQNAKFHVSEEKEFLPQSASNG
jgi:hypothetical protein